LQDFTKYSDINWNLPVSSIDQQLYKKYGLTQEEIRFIETNVKEMA
jgi:type II restriction enzyme